MRYRSTILSILLLTGCAKWGPATPVAALPAPESPRERIRLTLGDSTYDLHSIRVGHDSISGVSWLLDPACDSCRRTFALAEVTTAQRRVPAPDDSRALTALGIIGALVLAVHLIALSFVGKA